MTATIARTLKVAVLGLGMVLIGCASNGPKEDAGMVIGGVLGGILGAQVGDGDDDLRTVAIIAGTLAGAAIGGQIGRSMDDTDRLRAGQSLESVRTGVTSSWRNPDTGVAYEFTPTRTYEQSTGPCREFDMKATIGSQPEQVYGTACRQADGSWRIQG